MKNILSSRKPLFWLTLAAWILTVMSAVLIKNQEDWSLHMTRLRDLGFDYGGTSRIIALELAGDQASFDFMLPPRWEGGEEDRKAILNDRNVTAAMVKWDFPFIVGYTALFILLVLRQKPSRWRAFQISLAGLGALLDVVEDVQLLAAIGHAPGWVVFMPRLLIVAATAKWMSLFLLLVFLGYAELTQSTYRSLPAFWRCLTGMLMMVGGLAGSWWMGGVNSGLLIQNGFAFVMVALALMPVRFFMPDGRWCPKCGYQHVK